MSVKTMSSSVTSLHIVRLSTGTHPPPLFTISHHPDSPFPHPAYVIMKTYILHMTVLLTDVFYSLLFFCLFLCGSKKGLLLIKHSRTMETTTSSTLPVIHTNSLLDKACAFSCQSLISQTTPEQLAQLVLLWLSSRGCFNFSMKFKQQSTKMYRFILQSQQISPHLYPLPVVHHMPNIRNYIRSQLEISEQSLHYHRMKRRLGFTQVQRPLGSWVHPSTTASLGSRPDVPFLPW